MSAAAVPGARPRTAVATVAMFGAGQLAQMTHQAAVSLGVRLRVLAAGGEDCAVAAGAEHLIARRPAAADLLALAAGADVLTFDNERVDPATLARLEAGGVRLAPTAAAKLLAQDKLHARRTLRRLGFPLPPFAHARGAADVDRFAAEHGWPLVGKAPRGGYDGRGVFRLADRRAAEAALRAHPGGLLLEPALAIERELAVLLARSTTGELVVYPVAETVQEEAICREILAPAPVPAAVAEEARRLAVGIAEAIDASGVVAVELFLTGDGLLVNELALRPHNSGHFTIEGCASSQFEQHLRAVLGWPLGPTDLRAAAVATANVIGGADPHDPRTLAAAALAGTPAHLHLYGKAPRAGRKLGHVTVLGEDLGAARVEAVRVARLLEGSADAEPRR